MRYDETLGDTGPRNAGGSGDSGAPADTTRAGGAGSVSSEAGAPAGRAGARPAGAKLVAAVTVRRGTFTLEVDIAAEPGQVLAVLGPNGAGKSTLLGVLAGLIRPDSGTVTLGDRTLTGPDVAVPVERRGVGLMGQDPLLFPHLTALENIAFGPRAQGVPAAAARQAARRHLGAMGLAEFADRRPAQLSGGQRQRVALARALAAEPRLLLLDEPLGALDAQTAPEIRQVLATHIRAAGVTTLLVTHDVVDAATLADAAVVIADGAVVDAGPIARVLAAPTHPFTAAIAGLNIVTGMTSSAAEPDRPAAVRPPSGGLLQGIAAEPLAAGRGAIAVFAPSAVSVYLDEPGLGSPRNAWQADIVALQPGPSAIRVQARLRDTGAAEGGVIPGDEAGDVVISADLTAAAVAELGLAPGSLVHLTVKATEVRVHPAGRI